MDDRQLFTDAEYCIDKYFDEHLKPRLGELMKFREDTKAGTLATGFGVRNALLPTREYASDVTFGFPANDIEKLWSEIGNDPDIETLATAWRTAAEAQMGEERYEAASAELGCDLARVYVGHRLSQRMIDYEVEQHPIKGSANYILSEAYQSSVLKYLSPGYNSDVQKVIDRKIVEKYDPRLLEKGAGKALGSLTDLVVTAPVSVPFLHITSMGALATWVGADVGVGVLEGVDKSDVGQMVSVTVFGDADALSHCRSDYSSVNPHSSELIAVANAELGKKIVSQSGVFGVGAGLGLQFVEQPDLSNEYTEKYDVKMEQLNQQADLHFSMREKFGDDRPRKEEAASGDAAALAPGSTKAVDGWGGLLDQLGLSGFGDIGKNLGYVLAMLPDILIGMFTGKSRNLKFGDNLLPIGAIIAGMFVKNPLLKMLLIGLGGANILNKAGHEALDRGGVKTSASMQFRSYADEPLDPRVKHPVLKGNTLDVSIDNIPMVISINSEAVDAYEKGMLPLNTLSNAVLRKYDEQQTAVAESYEQQARENMVERSRGVK